MLNNFSKLISNYKFLEYHILSVIKAQFFVQIVGGAFFLILNIFLAKNGFSDSEIAHFISFRFLAVMLLAFPLGFFIKGKILTKEINFTKDKLNSVFGNFLKTANIEKARLSSENEISFNLNKKFKFNNLNIKSNIDVDQIVIKNDFMFNF